MHFFDYHRIKSEQIQTNKGALLLCDPCLTQRPQSPPGSMLLECSTALACIEKRQTRMTGKLSGILCSHLLHLPVTSSILQPMGWAYGSRMTLAWTSRLLHTRQLSSRSLQSVPAPLLASHLATSACYALITFHPAIRLSAIPICLIHQVDWLYPSRRRKLRSDFHHCGQTSSSLVCIVIMTVIYQKIFKQKL